MSFFGRWSQEDDDYQDKITRSAQAELNNRLIRAREEYERTGSPAARNAMIAAEDELRGL